MHWIFLAGAIGAEVFATSSLRAATTAQPAWPWALASTAGYIAAFALLFGALESGASLATAYAIWAGVGVALTALVAWWVFDERITLATGIGLLLIVAGVVVIEGFGHGTEVAP